MKQVILGIETSCDETGAAILSKVGDRITILSNVVASSALLQSKYGGIIPEQAAREQVKAIIPVIQEAINDSRLTINQIDAIAVTQGPGLIGSLLVGVETAKTLSLVWDKPLIGVNHLLGHFYANWIKGKPVFPCIGLLVSGGHTDLVLFKSHQSYQYLGGTRDDAAGECFDKCARLLGLPYPGGPEISNLASKGNSKAFKLPRPMWNSLDCDFSFSGLKTAVANLVTARGPAAPQPHSMSSLSLRALNGAPRDASPLAKQELANLCASIEAAIVDSLVKKTVSAVQNTKVEQLLVAGGVAANQKLTEKLKKALPKIKLHIPPPDLCTDNAAMIAARAFFDSPLKDPLSLEANPNLSLSN